MTRLNTARISMTLSCLADRRMAGAVLRVLLVFTAVGAAIGSAGCKQSMEFGEVTGTVKIDGVPTAGVQVAFEPQSQDPRKILPAAYGMTDANGAYRLLRRGREPGAPIGLHHVRMTPVEQEGGKNAVIHPRYQANNALWADVKSGTNVIDFDLLSGRKSPPKPAATTPEE
jgi:hypothetical protein